jgi:hypothetical protein
MANKYFEQVLLSQVKGLALVSAGWSVGAVGAVSSVKGNMISGVTRTGTGAYKIALTDSFQALVVCNSVIVNATAAGVVAQAQVVDNSIAAAVPYVSIQFYDFAGSAADPASGCKVFVEILARNSTVAQKGE